MRRELAWARGRIVPSDHVASPEVYTKRALHARETEADGKGRLHDQHVAGRMLAPVRASGPERGFCGEKMSGPRESETSPALRLNSEVAYESCNLLSFPNPQ